MAKPDSKSLLSRYEAVPRKRRILLFVLLLAAVAGAYWYFLFQPQWEQRQAHHKTIQELDSQIATYQTKIARLPEIEKNLAKRQREWTYAQSLLPESSQEVEELLASIERLGKDVGVEFLLFAPGREEVQQFYASRNVDVRLRGQFHSLMRFFSRLSHLDRLVRLESLRLRPQGKGEQLELAVDSDISMYRALTEAEIAARDAKKQ
ncbi:type 4a pilus biogenesis protein PilO [Desulfohalobium retbaense]|uniref:Tfp pilus assembly protein PilO-like protein n=1 Tax=Desulfohalobium retbaense (strain ATCC 49708 / DSM 5692 / JCM 16813 / HR100) TaxID=485915 RepID=C8X4Y8_DESRD|nr:type 4a pilus biogenesis protein PilO [Desulfohalobium retbaense]ACV69485.1 Tfp pilus assembly protein PilO-like protein [Desulfohalobium retbaense DSM 5692]